MSNGIKNLMFDLGGVIMDIKRERAVEALKAIGLRDADNMLGVYGQKGPFLKLETGLITPDEFRTELRQSIDREVSDTQIDGAFTRFLIGIPVDRLHQLEDLAGEYGIYLLSNTNAIMWNGFIAEEFRKDGYSIEHYFSGTIASFEVKAYKPEPEIFRKAIEKFGIIPEETLFLDDSATNIEAAKALGFKGAHVVDDRPFKDYICHNDITAR